MRCNVVSWSLLILSCGAFPGRAADPEVPEKPTPEQIQAWRKEGPTAVDRLMREREELLAAAKEAKGEPQTLAQTVVTQTPEQREAWERVYALNAAIDTVAAARYSHESGLYWYTDESEARRVAERQGKPLLALRLLGNLDEELSCVNSRYFRILLYPDDQVRQLLHDKFILTWKSVRPVPKITVDLGDGRTVERTITGNSVHYVMLPDGKVVDVFPGLYGPKPFHERLIKAHAAALRAIGSKHPAAVLKDYRREREAELEAAWREDVAKYEEFQRQPKKSEVTADYVGQAPDRKKKTFWEVVAEFHPEYGELSPVSLGIIQHEALLGYNGKYFAGEKPVATRYGERIIPILGFAKGGDEGAIKQLLQCIQPSMKMDTVQNEYAGRYGALRYMLKGFDSTLDELNEEVYEHIFGYDPKDPWIGLANLDSLTALPKDRGLKQPARKD